MDLMMECNKYLSEAGGVVESLFFYVPILLLSNMSKHYSYTRRTSFSFCMFSSSLQQFSMLLFYHLFNNCIYLCSSHFVFDLDFLTVS